MPVAPALPVPVGGQVAVAGDWHGNIMWAVTSIDRIAHTGASTTVLAAAA